IEGAGMLNEPGADATSVHVAPIPLIILRPPEPNCMYVCDEITGPEMLNPAGARSSGEEIWSWFSGRGLSLMGKGAPTSTSAAPAADVTCAALCANTVFAGAPAIAAGTPRSRHAARRLDRLRGRAFICPPSCRGGARPHAFSPLPPGSWATLRAAGG